MSSPLFTVVIPSLNQARFLAQAIRSVLNQEVLVELMIVDGGSQDDSVEIIRRHEPALSWWRSGSDEGQGSAINEALARATGHYFLWLNSDDLLLPGALKRAGEYLTAHPGCEVLYGDALFIDETGRVGGAYPTSPFSADLLKSFCYISQPSCLVQTERLRGVGGLDAGLEYALDYELWLRLLKAGAAFHYVPQLLSATRLHGDTKTSTGGAAFTREVLVSQQRHFPGASPAARATWARYRQLLAGERRMSPAVALASAWARQAMLPKCWVPTTRWVMQVARLHLRAWQRGRMFAGRKASLGHP